MLSLDQALTGGRDTKPTTDLIIPTTYMHTGSKTARRKKGWKTDRLPDSVDPTHRPTCICLYPSTGVDLHELPFSRRKRRGRRRRTGVRHTVLSIEWCFKKER
jgi:hypothetical protein